MENNWKGTQGEWVYDEKRKVVMGSNGAGIAIDLGIVNIGHWKEDAKLIVEAGNVRQQIPFSLTELLEQRNKMFEILEECYSEFVNYRKAFGQGSSLESKIEQLIKAAE